jgi:uncharacterized protein YqeY
MSTLTERLRADLTSAMRQRDETRLTALRMALTVIQTEEVAGDAARTLDEAEIEAVLRREQRKRRESAEAFAEAGRTEQAERERAAADVIAEYLPQQLTDAELTALVRETVAELGVSGPKAMGQVMKAVNGRVAGRADGGRVAAEVRRVLAAG